jgi:glutamyl-tRNA reductase
MTGTSWARGCLVMVGISHHAASLDVRERLAMSAASWAELAPPDVPSVLLSTCNRVEVYAWGSGRGLRVAAQLRRALAHAARMPLAALAPHLVTRTASEATLHLVRVASGLDSLVVGEEQIRGQVRAAFRDASTSTPLPAPLLGIFQRVLRASREVRVETPLGHHPSIATAGIDVALRQPALAGRRPDGLNVLVLGAGVMAKSALEHLVPLGPRLTVLNRTLANAERLADGFGPGVGVDSIDALPAHLLAADLVVCGTAARRPILDAAMLAAARDVRARRPLVVLDIAVPRDVDPLAHTLDGVCLIDLDDLERLCPVDIRDRQAETDRVEARAAEAAATIDTWLRVRALGPAIAALRQQGEDVCRDELRRTFARLPSLEPREREAIEELAERIANKLLHRPTLALRASAESARQRRR